MAIVSRKTGKKNRKFGRGLKKPAHARYNAEGRRETNKARKMAKQARKEEKARLKKKGMSDASIPV